VWVTNTMVLSRRRRGAEFALKFGAGNGIESSERLSSCIGGSRRGACDPRADAGRRKFAGEAMRKVAQIKPTK